MADIYRARPTDMPAEFLSRERFRAQLRSGGRKEGASIFEKVKVRRAKRIKSSPFRGSTLAGYAHNFSAMEYFIGVHSCIPNLIIGRRRSLSKGCANMTK